MKTKPKISIVIRTLNEKEKLKQLLEAIKEQDYVGSYEIVVVDNESTDGCPELARKYGAEVVTIKRNEFTYPKSINMGVTVASGELIVLTVGHALPYRKDWLSIGSRHFKDKKVAGVQGLIAPQKDCTLVELLTYWPFYFKQRLRGLYEVKKISLNDVFGAVNCMVRKSVWEKHHFDEDYQLGGEDSQWAKWAINNGYKIINEPCFVIRHSHNQGLVDLTRQLILWKRMSMPSKFNLKTLRFRKDLKLGKR